MVTTNSKDIKILNMYILPIKIIENIIPTRVKCVPKAHQALNKENLESRIIIF